MEKTALTSALSIIYNNPRSTELCHRHLSSQRVPCSILAKGKNPKQLSTDGFFILVEKTLVWLTWDSFLTSVGELVWIQLFLPMEHCLKIHLHTLTGTSQLKKILPELHHANSNTTGFYFLKIIIALTLHYFPTCRI